MRCCVFGCVGFGADVVDISLLLWMSWRDDGVMLHLVVKNLQPAEVRKRSIWGRLACIGDILYLYILYIGNDE